MTAQSAVSHRLNILVTTTYLLGLVVIAFNQMEV